MGENIRDVGGNVTPVSRIIMSTVKLNTVAKSIISQEALLYLKPLILPRLRRDPYFFTESNHHREKRIGFKRVKEKQSKGETLMHRRSEKQP